MRTAFIFDTVISTCDKQNFYTRTLHYDLWKNRYFKYFGEINVVTRVKVETTEDIKKNPMLQLINGEDVIINPIYSYKNVTDVIKKKSTIKKELKQQLLIVDFVIIRMPSVLGIVAVNLCKEMKVPYLIELVADPWDGYYYHTHWAGKILAPVMYFNTKKVVKKSTNVLYVTRQFLQKRYPSLGKNIIGLSDVIIKTPSFEEIELNIKNRIENINNKTIKFGLVGNYDLRTKGQNLALLALNNLKQDNVLFELELVGTGDKSYLEKLTKELDMEDNIKFVGTKQSGKEMFDWMDTLDVLLVPSYQEGLPRVIIEAMSRGLMIIGSTAGGIYELIDKEYIFRKGNYKDLYGVLRKQILDNTRDNQVFIENYNNSMMYDETLLNSDRNKFYKQIVQGV